MSLDSILQSFRVVEDNDGSDFPYSSGRSKDEMLPEVLNQCASMVADSINGLQPSLKSIATAISVGLNQIADEMRKQRLKKEFWECLDQLRRFKKENPQVEIEIDLEHVGLPILKDEEFVTLAYIFEKYPDFYENFQSCCNAGQKPAEWLHTLFETSRYETWWDSKKHKDYFRMRSDIGEIYLPLIFRNKKNAFIVEKSEDAFHSRCWNYSVGYWDENYFNILKVFYDMYEPESAKYYELSHGINTLNAWLEERRCTVLVAYLGELYTKALLSTF